jgi:mannose-6-phosphate isomerase-like protein (cupin superfamily)
MKKLERDYTRNLNRPDERREFKAHGHLDVINLFDGSTLGRGVFEPGWKWSNDVKPIADTANCTAEHHGYCISGSMVILMDNGDEFRISAGDAFAIPPGHDAWVVGNEPCVLIDFSGFKTYAKKAAA